MTADIRLEIYVDPATYLALRKRADDSDRSMSGHVRHLIREDLILAISAHRADETSHQDDGNTGEPA